MEPLKTYDYLATTRGRILEKVRLLGADEYAREFPIGLGALGRILTHIMISEYYYAQRMAEAGVPPYEQWPIRQEEPPPCAALEAAWEKQAETTRAVLRATRDWDVKLEYRVTLDDGRQQIVTTTPGDLFTQLVLHEVHHRAQVMNILRQLGHPADDVDYSRFFPRRDVDA